MQVVSTIGPFRQPQWDSAIGSDHLARSQSSQWTRKSGDSEEKKYLVRQSQGSLFSPYKQTRTEYYGIFFIIHQP